MTRTISDKICYYNKLSEQETGYTQVEAIQKKLTYNTTTKSKLRISYNQVTQVIICQTREQQLHHMLCNNLNTVNNTIRADCTGDVLCYIMI
jgi:hypothetical protein